MKKYIFKIFVLLLALLPVSCDRSGIYEEFQKDIDWNFCVVAVADDNRTQPISGATVEIKDANGTFAARTDAYVAYKTSNTANVEGTMVVTLADGTVYEYNVIFDLGL